MSLLLQSLNVRRMRMKLKLFSPTKETVEERLPLAIDTNSKFVYKSGADVQQTWRKYGWTPPSEYRTDYEFAKNRGMA